MVPYIMHIIFIMALKTCLGNNAYSLFSGKFRSWCFTSKSCEASLLAMYIQNGLSNPFFVDDHNLTLESGVNYFNSIHNKQNLVHLSFGFQQNRESEVSEEIRCEGAEMQQKQDLATHEKHKRMKRWCKCVMMSVVRVSYKVLPRETAKLIVSQNNYVSG